MWKSALILSLALLAISSQLPAQNYPLPNATVGVPYSLDFLGDLSQLQTIFNQAGIEFSLTFSVTSGALPPGLTLSNGAISGTPSAAGTYSFTIGEAILLVIEGQTLLNQTFPIPVSIEVDGYTGAALSVDPGALTFPLTSGSTALASQSVSISNHGSQSQSFTATANTASGGSWLSVSPGGGTAAFGSTSLSVNVDPSKLTTGTYSGSVTISFAPSAQTVSVAVVATVSGGQKQIQLSQTGLRFQAVAGGGTPPSQAIAVLNGGSGSLSFSASASTLSRRRLAFGLPVLRDSQLGRAARPYGKC